MNSNRRKISAPSGHTFFFEIIQRDKTYKNNFTKGLEIRSTDGQLYYIDIPKKWDRDDLIEKIIVAFVYYPAWRDNFARFVFEHKQVYCDVLHQNGSLTKEKVDHAIAPFVEALNTQGFRTTASGSGDNHPNGRLPYIRFASDIPHDLESVCTKLGWLGLEPVISPTSINGTNHLAWRSFYLLLDDWAFGEVDRTAQRYLVIRSPAPAIPPLPTFHGHAEKAYQRYVKEQANKINKKQGKASFDEMLSLRSGRDKYSAWGLERLMEELKSDPLLNDVVSLVKGDEKALKRALRWRLRGLDLDGIREKQRIDKAFQTRKQEKSSS